MADIADGEPRRLDPRVIQLNRISGGIVTASVSLSLFVAAIILWLSGSLEGQLASAVVPAWVVVTAGLGWALYVWPERHYRRTSYILDPQGLQIRTGVYWRTVMSVPRSRVQHIDVSQGPIERTYGLGTLVVYTAGTAHSEVRLAGLDHQTALQLRDRLLPESGDDAI